MSSCTNENIHFWIELIAIFRNAVKSDESQTDLPGEISGLGPESTIETIFSSKARVMVIISYYTFKPSVFYP